MRLLHLVKQHHAVGAPAHGLGQLSALFVADVSGGGTGHPAGGKGVHVLTHVQPNHSVLGVEQLLRKSLAELCLPHPGGPKEHEVGEGAVGVGQAGAAPLHGLGNSCDCLVLPHHALVQAVAQGQDALHLGLEHLLHGYAAPLGHDLGDVIRNHLLTDKGHVAQLALRRLQFSLQVVPNAVPQAGGLFQVVLPLSLRCSNVDVLHLFLDSVDLCPRLLLLEPAVVQLHLPLLQRLDLVLEVRDACRAARANFAICRALKRQQFHLISQQGSLNLLELDRLARGL
mmetsp:Transcript_31777/g.51627  ORF Transcript_31777/g.51627 Transcript_31777/m.51627 type:complete len:284 (-) Transcript_31777:1603-2454(-)